MAENYASLVDGFKPTFLAKNLATPEELERLTETLSAERGDHKLELVVPFTYVWGRRR